MQMRARDMKRTIEPRLALLGTLIGYRIRRAAGRMMADLRATLAPYGMRPVLFAIMELIHAEPARAGVLAQPLSDALAVGIRGAERGIALWPSFIPDVIAPNAHDASRMVPLLQPLASG